MHRIWKMKRIFAAIALVLAVVAPVWLTIEMMNDLKKPTPKGHQAIRSY